jgi:uncharacterized LabA/DUF88 family protein
MHRWAFLFDMQQSKRNLPQKRRVAILIDGSNFVNCLARAFLGFPALQPFLSSLLEEHDELVFARFYYAPLTSQPHRARWQRFEAINRHVPKLEFWHGHRDEKDREKEVDVALAVDLIYGASHDAFDHVIVVGGDGDHRYAMEVASRMKSVFVVLVEEQKASAVRRLARTTANLHPHNRGVKYREISGQEFMTLGICASGAFEPCPLPI